MRVIYWSKSQLPCIQIIQRLTAVAGEAIVVVETLPELLQALPGTDALLLWDVPEATARQVIAALRAPGSTVRWMHILSAGREGLEAAGLPKNVLVTSASGAVASTVAEHAMALLLALGRRVPEMVIQTMERRWNRELVSRASSLEGGTMALVGFGNIGREIAKRASAFGMRIEAVTRSPRADELVTVHPLKDLHQVIPRADAIVAAIALAPETRHLFDAAAFARCKPTALFVNVGRGGLVNQPALREALSTGQIRGAALDTTDPEPLPSDDLLWSAPGLVISPHFGGLGSLPSIQRLAEGAAKNLARLMTGEELHGVVA
jgi:phosphoglycerate dehydrogenase-like enzyme